MHKHKWKIGDKWDHVDPHCRCGTGLSWTEAERYLNSHADLLEALEDLFALMDENKLVRNTANDHLPSFATDAMKFTMRLSKAQQAIEKAKE